MAQTLQSSPRASAAWARPAVAVGDFIVLTGETFAAMLRPPYAWRELIEQIWFVARVSVVPTVVLSIPYTVLIVFFFRAAPGGFDTLANVQALFTSPWAALAGWVHYLAFDLFIGALIARRVMERGIPRLVLVVLLPATFLFGPIGLLLSEITFLLLHREKTS